MDSDFKENKKISIDDTFLIITVKDLTLILQKIQIIILKK